MSDITVRQKMTYLYDKLKRFRYHIEINDELVFEEDEYDKLIKELRQLERSHPHLKLERSPTDKKRLYEKSYKFDTVKLNDRVEVFREVRLVEDIKKIIDTNKEINGTDIVYYVDVVPVSDTVLLEYVYGNLYRAYLVTEDIGEDITENINHVYDIPKYIPQLKKIEKFEVICSLYLENILNEEAEDNESYLKRKIRTLSNNRGEYDIIRSYARTIVEGSKMSIVNQRRIEQRLSGLGFTTQNQILVTNDYKEIEKLIKTLDNTENLITVIVDNIEKRKSLPEWGVIYKGKKDGSYDKRNN